MKPKGRPKRLRKIKAQPTILRYSPRGKPGRPDEIDLTIDEFEAIRLSDYQGSAQEESAKSMCISQETFSRILRQAHKKIADGLVNGKIMKIEGGNYIIDSNQINQKIRPEFRTRKQVYNK